eukprot:TRINITY_DN92331_c0_g1_i1.p2 TRINITY_DN92331_c0_g1~~TRINITY_DN92331_c0_g1_i1.p2  ORF type:complete len:143 (-),score=31.84 TRINITY_DN92331_c0_g1_i1:802-1230(-)
MERPFNTRRRRMMRGYTRSKAQWERLYVRNTDTAPISEKLVQEVIKEAKKKNREDFASQETRASSAETTSVSAEEEGSVPDIDRDSCSSTKASEDAHSVTTAGDENASAVANDEEEQEEDLMLFTADLYGSFFPMTNMITFI